MKHIKVCLISHHFKTPQILLDSILKMTPNCSGRWKEMEAVIDPYKADYVIGLDGYIHIPAPEDRRIYFGQHPYGHRAYKSLEGIKCIAKYPQKDYLNPGEWWISHTYDELTALEPPIKTKDIISITTYHTEQITYRDRTAFLEEYAKQSDNIDIYGRQEDRYRANPIFNSTYRGRVGNPVGCNTLAGEHIICKEIEIDYRYALDFDHGKTTTGEPVSNYFSERFYDSMLLWTMPIYFGGDNVHQYLPENSFRYIDIRSNDRNIITSEAKKAIDIVNSSYREEHIADIAEARDLLLNKYQLWPYIYDKIKSL